VRDHDRAVAAPVILFGAAHWKGLLDWLGGVVLREKKIAATDLDQLIVTDDPEEVVAAICAASESQRRTGAR
jgi:predicted Rossmann-fold nucleotide-binding protein